MKRIAVYICCVLSVCLLLTGCTFNSGIRIGYVENTGRDIWSGSYKKLDANMSRKLNVEAETVCVTIVTKAGNISVRVIGDNDEVLAEISEEGRYIVGASGELMIEIEAEEHCGSFDIHPVA